jgi:DivIVA domain-containing protein
MMWLFAILIVLALGAVAVVAAGRGTPMSRAYDDAPDSLVPQDGPVTAEDLRRIRFPLAFRGYRMAEVDALLERLAEEREAAEAEGGRSDARRPTDRDAEGDPGKGLS